VAIRYTDELTGVEAQHLHGFFVGWPQPMSPQNHLRLLAGSDYVVLAIDMDTDRVVGFITALTDGVLTGFIPLLEVLPAYQGQGIGRGLMNRMLDRLRELANIDLMCDPDVVSFYERFGMQSATGMVLRRRLAYRADAK
jgi:GNAT superfamily N-acetyltransferase